MRTKARYVVWDRGYDMGDCCGGRWCIVDRHEHVPEKVPGKLSYTDLKGKEIEVDCLIDNWQYSSEGKIINWEYSKSSAQESVSERNREKEDNRRKDKEE
jgi:hypothetical protein